MLAALSRPAASWLAGGGAAGVVAGATGGGAASVILRRSIARRGPGLQWAGHK
jgi:hypothetical protein